MDKNKDSEECLRELAQALLRFQFIEEGLRLYVKRAYMLTQKTTRGKLTVRFSVNDLAKQTLKPLLKEFKKFNTNDALIDQINRLIPQRNDLAHIAFFEMYEQLVDGKDLLTVRSKALSTADEAGKCVEQLLDELRSIETVCEKEGLFKQPQKPS